MKRRDFLQYAGAVLAVIAGRPRNSFGLSQNAGRGAPPKRGRKTIVALAGVRKGGSEGEMKSAVRAAAESVTDFSWLSKGDSVFIKPALNSGNPYPATTSPMAVGAMIELLKGRGARRVIVGDMSGVEHVKLSPEGLVGSTRRLMEASGMAGAVKAAGGEMHFFEEAGWHAFYEDAPVSGSHWKRALMMPKILQEVEHIILMPRCARHVLAGSTMGLKAAVGYWRTDTRLEYHRDASTFHEKTAEGNTVETLLKKQRLVLSAADKILTTFGPDEGLVFEPENGLVIASASVAAHDMVSLAWLLENRRHISIEGRDWVKDNHDWVARIANCYVVNKLGGWRPMIASERLIKNDLHSIWDDRVLNRAYHVLGGMPRVTIEAANKAVSEDIKRRLSEKTAWPPQFSKR
jgi:uncharacterized protein (DUF362 family)